jgi:hypothetical protein
MIEGRKIKQISVVFLRLVDGSHMRHVIEEDWNVTTFKRYLFSDEDPGDGSMYRQKDLIQFYADPGGLRTINAEDIIL